MRVNREDVNTYWLSTDIVLLLDYYAFDAEAIEEDENDFTEIGTEYIPARHKYVDAPAVLAIHFEKSFREVPNVFAQAFVNFSKSFSFTTTVSSISSTDLELLVYCTTCPYYSNYWKDFVQVDWRAWPRQTFVQTPNGTLIDFGGSPFHNLTGVGECRSSEGLLTSIVHYPPFTSFVSPPGMLVMPYLGADAQLYDEYGLSIAQTIGVTASSVSDQTGEFSVVSLNSPYGSSSNSNRSWKNQLMASWFTWNGTDTDCPKQTEDSFICDGHGTCVNGVCGCDAGWRNQYCSNCAKGYYGGKCKACPGLIKKS